MRFSLVCCAKQFVHTFVVTAGLSLLLTSCFETKEDTPSQAPIGNIQGKLLDSSTQEPIVGAIINIGGAVGTTNSAGQYTINNINIQVDSSNNIKSAVYKISLDMRNVTAPVNMSDTSTSSRYADFSYDRRSLSFASAPSTATTPVRYLLEDIDFKIGKLSSNIIGAVADKNTLQPVVAGYTVKLFSLGTPAGSGLTQIETLVGSTVTDASGGFTFSNIESFRNFRIDSASADQTVIGSLAITAPADGQTKTLSAQTNNAVLVASTDALSPTIISITPQNDSDIAPVAADIVFTFSEPVLQTADTSTSPTVANGLYNKVDVKYMGAKASNIAHSLSWNSLFTQLTISIPSLAASSKYTVDLTPANALFVDLNGNALDNTIDKRVLNFTTNGSTTPAAPAVITVVNSASMNYNSPTVLLNWLPVSGAKAYNVYRAQNFPGAVGQFQLVGSNPSTLTSDFSDTLPSAYFVSGQNKLTYTYAVKSVSADNLESLASPEVTAQDTVVPTATIPTGLAAVYTITYSEPVDEVSATTLTNYILTQGSAASVPTVVGALLNAGLTTVTLTLNASTTIGNVLAITGVTDIAGNVMTSALRTF